MATAVVVVATLVVAMWWHDTPAASLRTAAEQVAAAGRITGLVGTWLLLVGILLMGRVPWIDHLIGIDRLAVWHRRNGQYVVGLLCAHAVLITAGYAMDDHVPVLREARIVVLDYPDMLAATVGLGLLVAVAITSVRAARRHLRHETWYFVHLYTYLAIALSFSHELATGGDFDKQPVNRALWIALYAACLGVFVWYRVGVPVRDAARHRLRVARVVPEGDSVASIYITGRRLDELHIEPGQFLRWRFLARSTWWHSHPFSLSAVPNGQWLRLTVRERGDHTGSVARLRPGVAVLAEGPYGAFTRHRRTRRGVLLVAGGIGITPLRALFEGLPAGPGDLDLVYRASVPTDLLFRQELDGIAAARGASVHYLTGPRTQRPDPFSPRVLQSLVPDVAERDVFVCGPPGMLVAAMRGLRAAGVPAARIHHEGFEL